MSRTFLTFVIVFALLLTFATPVRALSDCPADITVDQGKAALDAGQYQEAITAFTCVIESDSSNADAYIGRSEAYVLNGDWLLAFGDYRSASLYLTGSQPLWEVLEARFNQIIHADPSKAAGRIFRAHWNWYANQDANALQEYDLILLLEPDNVFALTFRGSSRLFLQMEDYEADWARALELAPENASVPAIIAATYRGVGDPNQALEYANRALEIDPMFASGYLMRGRVHLALENALAAVDDFNHAVDLGLPPTRAVEALSYMGEAYLYLNRIEDATASFKRAEMTMPGSPWVGWCIGYSYDEAQHSEESASAYLDYVNRLGAENIQQDMLKIDEPLTISLEPSGWNEYRLQVELKKDQIVQFEATDINNMYTDPVMVLVSPRHTPLAANNDQENPFRLDAAIHDFTVPYDGVYTLLVTSSLDGSAGRVEIRFTEEPGPKT